MEGGMKMNTAVGVRTNNGLTLVGICNPDPERMDRSKGVDSEQNQL